MIDINDLRFSAANSVRDLALLPSEVLELIDRLEAAEKERDWHAERCEDAMNECDALRAEIEELHMLISAVKKQADAEFRIRVKKEEEYARLCAKIEAMEQQEPVDVGSDVFRSAFEAALKAGNWPATRQGDDYRSPSTQFAWRITFSTVNRLKLYLAPDAQGEEE